MNSRRRNKNQLIAKSVHDKAKTGTTQAGLKCPVTILIVTQKIKGFCAFYL